MTKEKESALPKFVLVNKWRWLNERNNDGQDKLDGNEFAYRCDLIDNNEK